MDPQDSPARLVHAPWRDLPEVAQRVASLARRFSADVCLGDILCDDHPRGDTAFTVIDEDVQITELSYGELSDESRRLATALRARGIERGTRVGVLMGKSRQLPIVLLALWRLGAVEVPLFTAFAGPAIAQRVRGAGAQLIIADPDQLPKLDGLVIDRLATGAPVAEMIAAGNPLAESVHIGPDELFLQLYTSGTTGTPKGVGVPAFAIAAFIAYAEYGLAIDQDDVFWNAADPGWAYGLYYGIVAPLAVGASNILLAGAFSAERTTAVMEKMGVTNFAAAPTVYRAMKKEGTQLTTRLSKASSAGEPLTPDVVQWAPVALGTEVRDHWGQTELGMAITNSWHPALQRAVARGSMGQALPGFAAGTREGSIVLSPAESPLMWFRGYVDAPQQTQERYSENGAWYLTGDAGRAEGDDFFFASRDDDLIIAAGYRIAPFDIESILVTEPDVAEAAVVGRPDEIRGEAIEAFVVLTTAANTESLTERLQTAVRGQYGAHGVPRRVHVVDTLPKTPSGKVQRFILRSRPTPEPSTGNTLT